MERCFKGYDEYEFLTVTHAVNDFCVVELSNFYLDVTVSRAWLTTSRSLITLFHRSMAASSRA